NLNNPKRDMVYVAMAGPLANFFMAIVWGIVMKIGYLLGSSNEFFSLPLIYMGYAGVFINAVLMMLNLLPILPLDGGRILAGLLPNKISLEFSKSERFGFPILIVIIAMGWLSNLLGPPVYFLQSSIFKILGI
ncbi:MAG: site-2 protease family protein, partial [Cycloclasticus sp.]